MNQPGRQRMKRGPRKIAARGGGRGISTRCHAGRRTGRGAAGHGRAGLAQRHDHARREPAPAAAAEVRRRDQGGCQGFEALLAAARGAAQGRAQRAAHHDRRPGLRRVGHLWRRHPDAGAGPHRQSGVALHAIPLDCSLLANAGGAHHRPQPSLGRLRRHLANCRRASRATTRSSAPRTPPSARF